MSLPAEAGGKARAAGRGPFVAGASGRAMGVVWGSFQSLRRMREFVQTGFSADKKLSHILNLHLQDNALMKSVFETHVAGLEAKMKVLTDRLNGQQKVIDKLQNKK